MEKALENSKMATVNYKRRWAEIKKKGEQEKKGE